LSKCNNNNPCPVHFIVIPFKESILSNFRDKTILEYSDEIKNTQQVLSLKDLNLLDGAAPK
jgi:Rrf2 family iron-sulfur cluster assembly transcriptional regulator